MGVLPYNDLTLQMYSLKATENTCEEMLGYFSEGILDQSKFCLGTAWSELKFQDVTIVSMHFLILGPLQM